MKTKKLICMVLAVLCVISLTGCSTAKNSNPHAASWLTEDMYESLESIQRVDEKGAFYEMEYSYDCYSPIITAVLEQATESMKPGCSAFSTYNTEEQFLLCRNYDYKHLDAEENATGLNVLIRMAPEGKLKSIGLCDAFWLDTTAYFAGALDDGETDLSSMMLAPYMCVDGMNEAGVTASLLVVDTKEGESVTNQDTGKESIMHSVLLRYIIDNAHDIEEAVEIAESYDIYSSGGKDLHIYVSDKSGASAVLEWRQYEGDEEQKLYVTYTNAATNFLVGFDDGEDSYRDDGSFRELFPGALTTFNNYKYGYGHGYHRFNTIVETLERYIQDDSNAYGIRNSVMKESQALDLLQVLSQDLGTEATSFTQFTAMYNLDELTVDYYIQADYENVYTFSLNDAE